MDEGEQTLSFAGVELDIARRELRRGAEVIDLQPRPLALLLYLAQHRDRIVPKQELLEQVWPDVFVSETALASALKDLRRVLGDDGSAQRIVRTWRRRGYRFVAHVDQRGARRGPANASAGACASGKGGDATPFVGRQDELAWLTSLAREAAAGAPRIALLCGEEGSGKTRLLDQLVASCAAEGMAVASGACQDDDSVPYRPLAQVISAWLVALDQDLEAPLGEDAHVLRALLQPGAVAIASAPGASVVAGARDRAELYSAVARAVLRLARDQAALLVLDDLHAADEATLQMLGHLVAALSDTRETCRLLIVAGLRPPRPGEALEQQLARLASEPVTSARNLAGFSEAELGRLAEALGGGRPAEAALAALRRATRGNPLLAREAIRHAIESGASLDELSADDLARFAPDARAAIGVRLARASTACREALRVAAFIGDRFGRLALASALGHDESRVARLLEEATACELIVGEGRSHRFAHPLVRHALQSDVGPAERGRIHARLADVLEDLYAGAGGEHAIEIAHHLLRADGVEPGRVARIARRAGDQAFALCAWRAAARLYLAALERNDGLGAAELAVLHLRTGIAYNHDLDGPSCVQHYARAAEAFESAGDLIGMARARMYLERARFTLGPVALGTGFDPTALEGLAERVADRAPALRGFLLETLAEAHWAAGDFERAVQQAERALVLGHNLEDDALCHHACMGLALARFSRLELREAIESWREALARARRLRDPWLGASPGPRLAQAFFLLGRVGEADATVRESLESARHAQNSADLALARAQQAVLQLASGELGPAEESAEATLRLVARCGYPWPGPFAAAALANARALAGRFDEALVALDLLLEPGRIFDRPGRAIQLFVAVLRELVRAWRDPRALDPARVDQLAGFARAARLDASLLSPLCALVELAADVGTPAAAAPALEVLALAEQRGVRLTPGWVFLVPRVLACGEALAGRLDEACVRFEGAVHVARGLGARVELARTLLDAAHAWRARGRNDDLARAAAALAEARALCRALGLTALERDGDDVRRLASRDAAR